MLVLEILRDCPVRFISQKWVMNRTEPDLRTLRRCPLTTRTAPKLRDILARAALTAPAYEADNQATETVAPDDREVNTAVVSAFKAAVAVEKEQCVRLRGLFTV